MTRDDIKALCDQLTYRPVGTTAAQMREAAALLRELAECRRGAEVSPDRCPAEPSACESPSGWRLDRINEGGMNMDLCTIICGLYLAGGAAHMGGHHEPGPGRAWMNDITRPRNPYGIAEIGWQSPTWRRLDLTIAGRHMSSTSTGTDYGSNTAELRVRWRPFNGRE